MFEVILIDDEPAIIKLLSGLINWNEYGFILKGTFVSSKAALSYLKLNHIDAVITDIKMSDMNGIEFAKILRSKYPTISIAFITAYRDIEYFQSAINLNVQSFILKPFTKEIFIDELNRFSIKIQERQLISFGEQYIFSEKQAFFDDLLIGKFVDSKSFLQKLNSINIKAPSDELSCIYFEFRITDISVLTQKQKSRTYYFSQAIEHFLSMYNNNFIYFVTQINEEVFNTMMLSMNKNEDLSKITAEKLREYSKSLMATLGIDVCIDKYVFYSDIDSLLAEINMPDTDDPIIKKAKTYMEKNFNNPITLTDVAKYVGMNPSYFSHYYKAMTNEAYTVALNTIRINHAKEMLKDEEIKISNLYYLLGYQSPSYFYKIFKAMTGYTPTNYRELMRK